jgi:hypothetical protein
MAQNTDTDTFDSSLDEIHADMEESMEEIEHCVRVFTISMLKKAKIFDASQRLWYVDVTEEHLPDVLKPVIGKFLVDKIRELSPKIGAVLMRRTRHGTSSSIAVIRIFTSPTALPNACECGRADRDNHYSQLGWNEHAHMFV